MRYLRPDIHNIFKLFTLQFIIIVAIILGAFQANAFSQNSITTPPNALEQDLSEYGCSIHSLSTDSLFRLGTNFLNKNVQSPDSALICYITAQNRLGKEHNIKMISAIAKSFINTAYVYSLKYFDYAEAYLNLKKAENICTENNLDSLLSIVQHSLATLRNKNYRVQNIYNRNPGNTNPNFEYFKKAFLTAQKVGMHDIMAYSLFNSIESSESKADTLNAIELAEQYLHSDIPDSNPSKEFITNLCNGVILFSNGNYEQAIESYGKMIPGGFPFKQDSLEMANGREHLIAKAYEAMGNYKKSSEILNNLLHDAEQRNELEALMILHRQLFNLYSKINDKEAARYHHLAYFTTKEEIAGMGNQGLTINEIELKQSIQDYQKSLLAASIKEQHDKVVIICISIAAVCAVLALILTIYFSRKQRHYIMELYKRNQPSNTEFKKEHASPGVNEASSISKSTSPPETRNSEPDIASSSIQSPKADTELIAKIEQIIQNDSSVFDPDYQMSRLCSQVGSNPTYVSRAINAHYGKNFKTVLTERRVREACRRLDNPGCNSTLTIEAICLEVGFKSRTAFASAFKNVTGLTPSEYRQAARKYMPS